MGSPPILALLLASSVIVAAVVYLATGNLFLGLIALLFDTVPVTIIYQTQLKAKRERTSVAQDRLSRYSGNDR